jgi:hypothetical protein
LLSLSPPSPSRPVQVKDGRDEGVFILIFHDLLPHPPDLFSVQVNNGRDEGVFILFFHDLLPHPPDLFKTTLVEIGSFSSYSFMTPSLTLQTCSSQHW